MNFYSEYQLQHESRFVNKIWVIDNSTQSTAIQNLKILPNGSFNIGILIGEEAYVTIQNETYQLREGIYLCAQFSIPASLSLQKFSKAILIQLQPWAFSYYPKNDFSNFLNQISANEINNNLFGKTIALHNSFLLETIIKITEDHFLAISQKYPQQNVIERMAREVLSQKGNCKIADILSTYDYSRRSLQSKFKKATGLTLKQFAKIVQFRDSVDKIAYDQTEDSLTSIGYHSGYNDQSHFVKNFRQFSNTTPSKFNPENFVLSFKK